jgi:hypothetical protein
MKPVLRQRAARAAGSRHQLENGTTIMWLIVLEAVGALLVLVFVVWWTMFSGRRQGELPDEVQDELRGGNQKLKG